MSEADDEAPPAGAWAAPAAVLDRYEVVGFELARTLAPLGTLHAHDRATLELANPDALIRRVYAYAAYRLGDGTAKLFGRLTEKVPVKWLIAPGFLILGLGLLLLAGIHDTSSWTHLIPGLLISGVGIGMINPPLASTAVGVVQPRRERQNHPRQAPGPPL